MNGRTSLFTVIPTPIDLLQNTKLTPRRISFYSRCVNSSSDVRMRKRLFKFSVHFSGMILLMLALIAQSSAAVSAICTMPPGQMAAMEMHDATGMPEMSHMSHAAHPDSATSDAKSSMHDCCKEKSCSDTHCFSSSPFLLSLPTIDLFEQSAIVQIEYRLNYVSNLPYSFDRPPISG